MIGKMNFTSDGAKGREAKDPTLESRCAASVAHGRMGACQCSRRAANGDLCHQHAAIEDRGRTVNRVQLRRKAHDTTRKDGE
jgi:hypothetical protein